MEEYCSEFDADYDLETGEWLEGMCREWETCEYCSCRPSKHPDDCICLENR